MTPQLGSNQMLFYKKELSMAVIPGPVQWRRAKENTRPPRDACDGPTPDPPKNHDACGGGESQSDAEGHLKSLSFMLPPSQ